MTEFTTWRSLVDGEEIVAIPDGVVDNFEDADADPAGPYEDGEDITDYYGGATAGFARTTDNAVEGDKSLNGNQAESNEFIISEPNDGLPNYPDFGDTISFLLEDRGDISLPGAVYNGALGTDDTGYAAIIDTRDEIAIRRLDGQGNITVIASTSQTINENQVYYGEVDIPSENGDSHEFRIYNVDGLEPDNLLATVTATDDTYTDQRGIGWYAGSSSDHDTRMDRMRIE